MKNYHEYLSGIKLPSYILFKNLHFEHDFDIDASIARGEIVANDLSYDELYSKIPRPQFPTDEYKVSLLDEKYGQISESELEYDDTVFDIAEGDPNDYEIFGESFTIIFFAPPEEDSIVDFLVNQYQKNRDLVDIYMNYIDRLHIFPFYSLEETSDNFIENLGNRFQEKVRSLPQPPGQDEWDELKEYL